MTATGSTAGVSTGNLVSTVTLDQPPSPRWTEGLIKCVIGYANELILIPKTDLGASILAQFVGGDKRFIAQMRQRGPKDEWQYGRSLELVTIERSTPPMLSSGNDPDFTGMTITPDEQKACRALVEKLRAGIRKPRRKRAPS